MNKFSKKSQFTVMIFVLSCLFFLTPTFSQTVHEVERPFCLNQDIYDCFSDLINEADILLEVTTLARVYEGAIRTHMYQVEKIFKGAVPDTILIRTNMKEFFAKYENHVRKNYPDAEPLNYNFDKSGIYPVNFRTSIGIMALKQDSSQLSTILSFVSPTYNYFHHSRNLVSKSIGGQTMEFKKAKDLYAFILKHEKTFFKDVTSKKFKRYEEVLKKFKE